jgi:hypothetical protein
MVLITEWVEEDEDSLAQGAVAMPAEKPLETSSLIFFAVWTHRRLDFCAVWTHRLCDRL